MAGPPRTTCIDYGRHLYPYGYAYTPGSLPIMEDAIAAVGDFAGSGSSYFAIFDGHRGNDVSSYAANNIHRVFNKNYSSDIDIPEMLYVTVSEVNEYLKGKWPGQGATSAIAIIIRDRLYTANTGDSRILLIDPEGNVSQISEEHKVDDEGLRGLDSLSRSLGDGAVGRSGEPHMTRTHRKDGMWMIMASHGLWTVLDNEQAVRIAAKKTVAAAAAKLLKDVAVKKGATENISVIVVYLTPK
jgi:serine/threonine protein phosphatase PrpC